ncbi:aminodeoxychorismate synthase component I [Microbacterium sp. LRZ72]|uniref:aminodeoxychorismate synthase component I n=1 Tax=Microbacterium sp. LRZ72 TaxID=2942481 RepID=UPI0029AD78D4|nr:aminodeoxychorismate synthase component I [Microbacterium sp. LRZ72]MDX2375475.1 aminodeoxychorismate synthase component I [Microbacterium sp. LRZ72]
MPNHPVAVAVPSVDAAAVFAALEPNSTDVFWLDAGPRAREGWSYVGVGAASPAATALAQVSLRPDSDSAGSGVEPQTWPAGPFRGGWIGWFAYDGGAERAGAPVFRSRAAAENDAWMRAVRWVAIDHESGRAWAVSADGDPAAWAAAVTGMGHADAGEDASASPAGSARARHTPGEYAELIAACREAIRAGDAYQLCLTTRFDVDVDDAPASVYARLRRSSPAPYGGFLRIGDVTLLSASPERFLAVRAGRVETKPIKGTRPRAQESTRDAALAAELVDSAKERAENVMIVDLMRNDLARVCEPGSVRVDALLAVESYPHVHQLVSTVSGRLRSAVTLGELTARAFPAGSMTGAPKLSAMTILHRLEGAGRGIYSGCFGWVGDDGDLDVAMVIRSIVMQGSRASVGAGGGITWSSVVEDEVLEVGIKARAPLAALGAQLPPGW